MLGELIAAGASLAGGLLGKSSQDKANKTAQENALRQEALQKEFAQSGIQWKVQDAEKAGIHPLFALGANTTSYQPTSVGGGASDFSWLGETGQNIGRAVDSTRSTPAQALALEATRAQIQGLNLDNELKVTQLNSARALAHQTSTPGIPDLFQRGSIPGQGDSSQMLDIPGHKENTPQYTPNLRINGKNAQTSPRWSDAQAYEDRYGEMSDFVAGPMIALDDYRHNLRNYSRERVKDLIARGKVTIRPAPRAPKGGFAYKRRY